MRAAVPVPVAVPLTVAAPPAVAFVNMSEQPDAGHEHQGSGRAHFAPRRSKKTHAFLEPNVLLRTERSG